MKTDFTLPNAYNKINIVCYPRGTGGNFLINCLALSDDCVFLDAVLARNQLCNQFDLTGKCNYLKSKLAQAKLQKHWSDLDLGNGQFFGVNDHDMYFCFPEILAYKMDPIVNTVIKARKFFFCLCHHITGLQRLKELWPNANIIFFVNFSNFLSNRPRYNDRPALNSRRQIYWNTIKSEFYPDQPPSTMEEFGVLPEWLQKELTDHYDFEISRWFDSSKQESQLWHQAVDRFQTQHANSCMIWNVDHNFADTDKLFLSLSTISEKIGTTLVDKKILNWYYHEWRNTIEVC